MENQIFLISLKSDEKRRERLKDRFKSYDKFRIIEAVDGRIMSAREYFSYALASFKAYGRLLSPAEIGCSLSHSVAYEEFLKSGAKRALILEDDVLGDDLGIERAFELAERMSENSILMCGCQNLSTARFSIFGKRLDEGFYLLSKHSHISVYGTVAYVVSKSSAKALLSTHKEAVCTADFWGFLLGKNGLDMYFSDIFSHPDDLTLSNIQDARDLRGYDKKGLKAYVNSLKYIIKTRFEANFKGYERIFKRQK